MWRPNRKETDSRYFQNNNFGDGGFRSPFPRQNSPRFHPHSRGPPPHHNQRPDMTWTPNSARHMSPMGQRSPRPDFNTPQSMYNTSGHSSNPSPYSNRGSSNSSHSSSWSTPGGYGRNNSSKEWQNSPRGQFPDCNPGGSADIRAYYKQDMVRDPWAGVQAVPAGSGTPNPSFP